MSLPVPPSLSVLSPSLLIRYTSCGGVDRRLFKSLFTALWSFLWPVSRLDPVSHCYLLGPVLDSFKIKITLGEWFLLSRLFLLSGGGVSAIDRRTIKLSKFEINSIPNLIRAGLIRRSFFDPAFPHYSSHRSIQKVYISFTSSGFAFYGDVVKMLNRVVRDDIQAVQHNIITRRAGQLPDPL